MAKITIDTEFGFDQNALDFSSLFYAVDATRTSKTFAAFYSNGAIDEFRGSGFKYDGDGVPVGGTVKSYAGFQGGNRLFTVDGVKIKATGIVDAALTFSTKDDIGVVRKALGGSDSFRGANGTDVFNAYGGNDTLNGRRGSDVLTGGDGKDTFYFDTPLGSDNVDRITDFSHKDDTFKIENGIFKGVGGKGELDKDAFAIGAKADDKEDRIVYDKKHGDLYWDRDGSGGRYDLVKFAEVKDKADLSHNDFIVV